MSGKESEKGTNERWLSAARCICMHSLHIECAFDELEMIASAIESFGKCDEPMASAINQWGGPRIGDLTSGATYPAPSFVRFRSPWFVFVPHGTFSSWRVNTSFRVPVHVPYCNTLLSKFND